MIKTETINNILGIKETYKASDALLKLMMNKEERKHIFRLFLEEERDVSYDWFHTYFQEEQADRKVKKQDFTPQSIAKLLTALNGSDVNDDGMRLDVASGTGGLTIDRWHQDRMSHSPFEYKPSMYFYQCEELSDRALPFLLFNLSIRGMNATVVHGDTLTREINQVYFIQNDNDDYLQFSNINIMPQNTIVEREFDVRKWLQEEVNHIESPMPEYVELLLEKEKI